MKLRSVQILRGVAATAVVAHHAFGRGGHFGAAGVDLFFVISGFIMTTTCASRRGAAKFLADRAWRIYPMWLLALFPWLLMAPHSPLEIVRSITLWPVYGNQWVNPALGVGWTLSFELLFYLAFAAALATRRPAVPLCAFALCMALAFTTNQVLFGFLGSPLIFEFLLGVAIASVPPRASIGVPMMLVGAVWFALAPPIYYDQAFGAGALYRTIAWGIPAATLLYGARSIERSFAGATFEIPVLIGGASYSIYLFHQLVLLQFQGIAGFVLSIAAGVLAYLFVERHMMRARPRWGGIMRRQAKQAVAVAVIE